MKPQRLFTVYSNRRAVMDGAVDLASSPPKNISHGMNYRQIRYRAWLEETSARDKCRRATGSLLPSFWSPAKKLISAAAKAWKRVKWDSRVAGTSSTLLPPATACPPGPLTMNFAQGLDRD
nr:hypothetical protein CFP56_60665 [Quercus suber]